MSISIHQLLATEHVADLHRAAQRQGGLQGRHGQGQPTSIELRLGDSREAELARRVAALDDAPELEGRVLLAIVDGEAIAGLSLHDNRVVANPFVPTRDAIALLRLRAAHLSPAHVRRRLLGRVIAW